MIKEYNKLVRDNIPSILDGKGLDYKIHKAEDAELTQLLEKKLQEEVDEYLQSKDIHEIADIFEVLYAIIATKGISERDIRKVIDYKALIRGHFAQRIVLEYVMEKE